jgi:hypothetical protein
MSESSNPPLNTYRLLDWASIVKRIDGKDRAKVEDVYVFSNGRRFKNTDAAPGGPYGDEAESL